MTYEARVVKVMIASPSDVAAERQIIRSVLADWNAINSEDKRLVLLPIGWETHSTPEMGDRPQAIINKQILKDCDILIAAFWTRIGSPTGTSISGTVEEIEEHIRAGKPAMLYFSSVPVELDSVDQEQYNALKEFRNACKERGLVETYDSLTDFREKLLRQLSHKIIRTYCGDGEEASTLVLPPPQIPPLSPEAKELLLEASHDKGGLIIHVRTFDGLSIETNGRNFTENADARTEARWDSALVSLESEGYIADRGHKGEVFAVTDEGYKVAEQIRAFRERTRETELVERERQAVLKDTFARYRDDGVFNNLWRRFGIAGTDLIEAIKNAKSIDDFALIIDSRSASIGAGTVAFQLFRNPQSLAAINKIRAELGRPPFEPSPEI